MALTFRPLAILGLTALAGLLVFGTGCSDGKKTSGGGGANATASSGADSGSSERLPEVAKMTPDPKKLEDRIRESIDKGIKYLRANQDAQNGWVYFIPGNPETKHPGVTAMVLAAFFRSPRQYQPGDGPFVDRAVDWLVGLQKPDGAIFEHDNANYCTSLAILALTSNKVVASKYKPVIDKAVAFVARQQSNEENGYKKADKYFGGVGYGNDERPDLSNTQFGIEAAKAGGLDAGNKFFTDAIVFLQRCQNSGETNDSIWNVDGQEIRPGNDGGAIYAPGENKAGIEVLPDGRKVFRSYGSMSYALLKSYVFCGLDRRDPKVKAVAKWCAENFQLDLHPGFEPGPKADGQFQGLFYYYLTMATALRVYGEPNLTDKTGIVHDWRKELAEHLMKRQSADGSCVNDKNKRWEEASPVLCTGFATLALIECLASLTAK